MPNGPARAIDYARQHYTAPRLRFEVLEHWRPEASFDLCYSNGVFHHIRPGERPYAAGLIHRTLAPGGRFALFENNPLNPGTRIVMKRILFDRDTVALTPGETRRLLRAAGFGAVLRPRFLFYFPRPLAAFRCLEPSLVHVPLGAQYCVLAIKG